MKRSDANPILRPLPEHDWESSYVFNPAALLLEGKFHLIYRAIGSQAHSVFGYACSDDGIHFDHRSPTPVYIHHEMLKFTSSGFLRSISYQSGGSWAGCEDPRLTIINETIYMIYTVFDGYHAPCVALTSISAENFLKGHWLWKKPQMISPNGEMHKNWVIFPEKIAGKYVILHSISPNIQIDYLDNLDFADDTFVKSHYIASGRDCHWDSWIRGVGPTPLKIPQGWLVFYHAMDQHDPDRYMLGGMILKSDNPEIILHRSSLPLLKPDAVYENQGFKSGVIYCCGAVIKDDTVFIYYGGADTVVCVAQATLQELIDTIIG